MRYSEINPTTAPADDDLDAIMAKTMDDLKNNRGEDAQVVMKRIKEKQEIWQKLHGDNIR